MSASFNHSRYFARAAAVAEPIFRARAEHELDEQAGPAYFRGLSLSRWIFWKRLTAAMEQLPARGETVLDFGCGFGMLLPPLASRFGRVYGIDLMPELSREFLVRWHDAQHEPHASATIESSLDELQLPPHSLDCITALDVLEHIENLPVLLDQFRKLLKPTGLLIVSGPTENRLYRLGRKIVGFSGEYHVSDIHRIHQQMTEGFDVRVAQTILPVVPLFRILTATPLGEETAMRTRTVTPLALDCD